ncbi:hypothetical protein Agabi119p4_2674 [Agaricus bisporus var. burnettii]|uniref:Uncharacterized protein n=1 Tax=Agaricus bisporus var. burnettii TaxID=192524 RepID=A0A8H7F9M3_AGABI|nr:hypothetical protein Agabi119p4_2674 [Agaricus bisporus var. burnettii]
MASHVGLTRRTESNNNNIILIVSIIAGVVALLALIALIFIIRRRKSRKRQTLYDPSAPPLASYKYASEMGARSSLLRDTSSDLSRPLPYSLSSQKMSASDTSIRSSLQQEMTNTWYYPSPYPQPSHKRTTSDTNSRPSLQGYPKPYPSHSRFPSDSNSKLLLPELNNDRVYVERPVPVRRTGPEEHIASNNPTGQHYIQSSRQSSRSPDHAPAASTFCLLGMDVISSSNNPYLSPRPPLPRPPLPPLPPLIIPQKGIDRFASSQIPSTVAEESALPQQSAGYASSGSSTYSQSTPNSPSHPTYVIAPLNEAASPPLKQEEEGLARGNTAFVGTLLKARAERNPGGLVRGASVVSHIERTGSIKSVGDKRYARRYRAKKSGRIEDMPKALQQGLHRGSR